MDQYGKFMKISRTEKLSAYALDRQESCERVSKMAFGNRMGAKIEHNVDKICLLLHLEIFIAEVEDGKGWRTRNHLYRNR